MSFLDATVRSRARSASWGPSSPEGEPEVVQPLSKAKLNRFLKSLPGCELDSLVQTISNGMLDYNTVLYIKNPKTGQNLPVKAAELISVLGGPQDDDDYAYIEIEPISTISSHLEPAILCQPTPPPSEGSDLPRPLPEPRQFWEQLRTTPDPTERRTKSRKRKQFAHVPSMTFSMSTATDYSTYYDRSTLRGKVSRNRRCLIATSLVLLFITLGVILSILASEHSHPTSIISIDHIATSEKLMFQTADSKITPDFTYDAIDKVITVTKQLGSNPGTPGFRSNQYPNAYVKTLDPATLKTKQTSKIENMYVNNCVPSSDPNCLVYSLMGCDGDICKKNTNLCSCQQRSSKSHLVQCTSSDWTGRRFTDTVPDAVPCGIWGFEISSQGHSTLPWHLFFCSQPEDSPSPTPGAYLRNYRDYQLTSVITNTTYQLPTLDFCDQVTCLVRTIALTSQDRLLVFFDLHTHVNIDMNFTSELAEFQITPSNGTQLVSHFQVERLTEQLPNPWREDKMSVLLLKMPEYLVVVGFSKKAENATALAYDANENKFKTNLNYTNDKPDGGTKLKEMSYDDQVLILFQGHNAEGNFYSVVSYQVKTN